MKFTAFSLDKIFETFLGSESHTETRFHSRPLDEALIKLALIFPGLNELITFATSFA
jgi:hypothetical protein